MREEGRGTKCPVAFRLATGSPARKRQRQGQGSRCRLLLKMWEIKKGTWKGGQRDGEGPGLRGREAFLLRGQAPGWPARPAVARGFRGAHASPTDGL